MGVLLDPVCGDQGQQDRFLGLCLGAESVEACREFLLLSKRDLELVLTVLYLAKVYGLILAVDQKIDLNTFLGLASLAAPRAGQSLDSGDSESLLDLFQVAQAQHLEREAAPGVVPRYNWQRSQKVMCSPAPGIETENARKALEAKVDQINLPEGFP